jgi:L-ascorbate metabolism protein UlaG (beta-lactamase superfamily)
MRIRFRPEWSLAVVALTAGTPVAAQSARADTGVTVTFLANEGVLLSGGGRKVLIDALFLEYETGFAIPPDSTQRALQSGRPPFDSVGLVLVTHRHGDHFHPVPVAAHLRSNPRATLVTSGQVIDSLLRDPVARAVGPGRLIARTTAAGARQRIEVDGIAVELLGLPHGGRRHRQVEHLGYLVELGGRRILHVGDTELSDAAFAPFRLDTARIDVALLPSWAITDADGRRIVERWIRPRQVVAFHVGEGKGDEIERAVRAAIPGAVTFARPLETLHR